MPKHIITYILSAACILSSCRSDYYEFETATDGTAEELSLTVRTSETVISDGIISRADDQGPSTKFEEGDCVGVIIIDKDRRLLADNVPYKFNGTDWVFDADNNEGKQRVYYDATMSTYIVYYPYDKSVNGVKDEATLKGMQVFAQRKDQSEEMAFRFSDLMVWSHTGEALKHLPVDLEHVRNSFSLDLKLKWHLDLPADNILEYHPLREALIDFKVRLEDGTPILNDDIDHTYHAEDGTCRYILPDDYVGKVTWRYTYRGESFGGESNVPAGVTGVRHVQDTSADISYEKMQAYDYYSSKEINGASYGFVMPWDAEERFDDYPMLGVIFQLGHHKEDRSKYTTTGIDQEKCHGYVLALTNTGSLASWASEEMKTSGVIDPEARNIKDWSGYKNMVNIKNFTGDKGTYDEYSFPAAYACDTFAGETGEMAAPRNTSGWFLPTIDMWNFINENRLKIEGSFSALANYLDIPEYKLMLSNGPEGYWSSTEHQNQSDKVYYRDILHDTYGYTFKNVKKV